MRRAFDAFAAATARACASPLAFVAALAFVLAWLAGGPFYHWSDSYSLFINSSTTIITFLMAFIILAANARSEAAVQAKLDELIRATEGARNAMVGLEQRARDEIAAEAEAVRLAAK